MKLKPEVIFGGLAAAAGIFVAWKTATAPPAENVTTNVPPLQMPGTGSAATPVYDAVSTSPNLGELTSPPVGYDQPNQPYQTYNFGPSHVARKAMQQTKATQQAQSNGGCGCNSSIDPCTPCCSQTTPTNSQKVPRSIQSMGSFNLSTVSTTPQPARGNDSFLDSDIVQYHQSVAAQNIVAQYNGAGNTPIRDVPAASSLYGYVN
jgi:hypothetical protein